MIALALVGVAQGYDRYGPDGDAGIRRLLEVAGGTVSYRDASFAELEPIEGEPDILVVDLTTIEPGETDWEAIRAWVEVGNLLLVSGDATTGIPELGERVFGVQDPVHRLQDFASPRFDGSPPGFTGGLPLVGDEEGAPAAMVFLGDGLVIALADATSLWNGYLVHPDNERFLTELITRTDELGWYALEEPVIELGIGGSTPPSPPSAVANLRLLPFVLQVLVLWLVVVAWKGWPFRRNRDEAIAERADFGDHLAAVARHYRRLGARGHADAAYASWLLASEGRSGLLLAARRRGYAPADASQLVDRVTALAEGGEDQATMEELCRLMEHDR